MNQKGALFHWIVLGAFVALGIFVTFFLSPQLRQQVPGAWQQHFLQQGFFPAEAALLELDVKAREIGEQAVVELARNGGFINESPCGSLEGVHLWNNPDSWCLPAYRENAAMLAGTLLQQDFPQQAFSSYGFQGRIFFGRGNPHTISGDTFSYTYRQDFAVDMGYDLDNYQTLFDAAGKLLLQCRLVENLTACLQTYIPSGWARGFCEKSWDGVGRRVPFCVSEPITASRNLPLKYEFALDFSEKSIEDAAGEGS